MGEVLGKVFNSRENLVKDGVVILFEDKEEGIVALNSYNVDDIAAIRFVREGEAVNVFQDIAETPNFCLAGYTKERAEQFRSREESLGTVPHGDEATFLVYHPATQAFKYKVVVKPYTRDEYV